MPRCVQTAFASILLAAGMTSIVIQNSRAEQRADCGHQGVNVVYQDATELGSACTALTDILAYFGRIDFDIAPRFSLQFVERAGGRDSPLFSAHGYFDGTQSQIVVYRSSDAGAWGIPWSPKMAASFLGHELAHMAIWNIFNGKSARLPREWHEFIAYAIQIDLMDGQLRNNLLARQDHVEPFESLLAVNPLTYHMNPEVFAVAAYKTYLANGGASFVRQILHGEFVPPRIPYPLAPD